MRGIIKTIFFNLLALAMLIIIIEFIFDFRYFFSQPIDKHDIIYVRRMQEPLLDRFVIPEEKYIKHTSGLRKDSFRIVTNQDGLILGPRQYNLQQDINKCDILFMGGSTTECLFVHDSLRFAYRTSQILSASMGKDILSVNAARSGNHTFHTISNLIHTCLAYKPKMLVYMENVNDLALLSKTGSYHDAPPSRALKTQINTHRRGYGRHFIETYFPNIHKRYEVMISRLNKKPGSSNHDVDEFKGYRSMENQEELILQEFEMALKTLHGICLANGTRLVLMTQFNRLDSANRPFLDDINQHSGLQEFSKWIPTYIKMNQLIRDFSREQSITCIDLDREVPHTGQFIYDQVHVNDTGSAFVSEIIARELLADTTLTSLLSQ